MKKTFKYRIYASKETIAKAEYWLSLCCDLYNCCLEQRITAYHLKHETISGFDQFKEVTNLKVLFPEYKEVSSQTLQEVTERLYNAYQAFFRRCKNGEKPGFPRFKSKSRFDSFVLKRTGWHLEGRYLWIHKVGRFKMNLSREIEGNIKTITIKRTPTNKWYASFSCDNVPEKKLAISDKVIGLDMGIKSYLTDSEGKHVENPKWLKESEELLRRKQRCLSRRIKGSNRRKKARLLVAKAHEKVDNQRSDFLHKLANDYIENYGTIVVENLQIKNMVKNHHLAKSISDCAWGKFFELLSYKAEEAGRIVLKENPCNTSKMCSECGAINKALKLSDREWVCQSCGTLHDRDENASKNIKRLGQSHQELTYDNTQCVS
jgi:putative transposase